MRPWGEVAKSLLAALDAVADARKVAARWEEVYEAIDAPLSRWEVSRTCGHLDRAVEAIVAACEAVTRPRRDPPGPPPPAPA